ASPITHLPFRSNTMARVTVEDCLENVDNRFELVMLATKRARQIATGGKEPKGAWENDKPTVVALREIAEGLISDEIMAEEALHDQQEPLYSLESELPESRFTMAVHSASHRPPVSLQAGCSSGNGVLADLH